MVGGVSLGDITYTSQMRGIKGTIQGSAQPQHTAEFTAPDFGVFDEAPDVGDIGVSATRSRASDPSCYPIG